MSYTYANRKRGGETAPKKETASAQPSADALRTGAAKPTAEQMGHRVDLPDAMRAKMEESFGADLSAVKLYESEAVADAGAKAFTQGSNIAFAPGMLDFSSFGGQALLGHELSHVVSQARGEVTGGGFLNDHALESRADREGAMAAAGQTVAMPTAALSPVTVAATTGPIQAAGKKEAREAKASDKARAAQDAQVESLTQMIDMRNSTTDDVTGTKQYKALEKAWKKARKQETSGRRGMSMRANAGLMSTDIRLLAELRGRYGERDEEGGFYQDADQLLHIYDEAGDASGGKETYGSADMVQFLSNSSTSDLADAQQKGAMYRQLAAVQQNAPESPMRTELLNNFMGKMSMNERKADRISQFRNAWSLTDEDMSLDPRINDPEASNKLRQEYLYRHRRF